MNISTVNNLKTEIKINLIKLIGILRGSKLAYEVAKIPIELCEHIVKICDEYFER